MDVALLPNQVQRSLWNQYKKTKEYREGGVKAIPSRHKIVLDREKKGLALIYKYFEKVLLEDRDVKKILLTRTVGEWFLQWKKMHEKLFEYVLRPELRGEWRDGEVYFGEPANVEIHHIPRSEGVVREMSFLAKSIQDDLKNNYSNETEKLSFLARTHYQFIRIHPFMDGNGRIGRALVDQLAMFLDLPPLMSGYPRLNESKREKYHIAINSCAEDPKCRRLTVWIESYLRDRSDDIA